MSVRKITIYYRKVEIAAMLCSLALLKALEGFYFGPYIYPYLTELGTYMDGH